MKHRTGERWTPEEDKYIIETAASRLAHVADALGTTWRAVKGRRDDLRMQGRMGRPSEPIADPAVPPSEFEDQVLVEVKRGATTIAALSDALDRGPQTIRTALDSLWEKGYHITIEDDRVEIPTSAPSPKQDHVRIPMSHFRDGKCFRFGVVSDMHLGNKSARLDVLHAAYDKFADEGIREVFVPGNYIDGEAPFNKNELIVAPGLERQVAYFIEHYPQRDGITTRLLSGLDHEGWYAKREGIDVGRYLVNRARDQGRDDLDHMDWSECDVPFYAEPGATPAIVRFMHPSGGSAYATSYKLQKIVESLEGGNKPQVLIVGHYHKAGYFNFRNVQCLLAGCAESQTPFMRNKQLAAHVGFFIIEMQVSTDGSVTEFTPRYFPFFDEGFYEGRYPIGDIEPTRVA